MKLTTPQKNRLGEILAKQRGEFAESDVRDEWIAYLRDEHAAGRLGDFIAEIGAASFKTAINERAWKVDPDQGALFDEDALLALGGSSHVRMADARATHVLRHREILEANFEAQRRVFAAKQQWLNDRLPDLFERGCTLADLDRTPAPAAASARKAA
ncbi:hypothetical protein [Paraconexibacter algicola]|uniref:Uncharacterized protein n=1 Tax=Paraconexibacter algicola TaxID=2133960 RepID=A0A2T4UE26_9ACTN|nr:hypothetical protein [Paraconexibacter algicola]PTL55768.1 hypothetical protein C7Y72_19255 [Paraconexibacter algicola]